MADRGLANRVLFLNTLAFTVCFAVWTMYGVLGAFLADARLLQIDKAQLGWSIGAPILTGSLMRLPVGLLTAQLASGLLPRNASFMHGITEANGVVPPGARGI